MKNTMTAAQRALHASNRNDWETPGALFGELDRIFKFTLDAAASRANHKVKDYYTTADNALTQAWRGRVWCNPPYGLGDVTGRWVRKGLSEYLAGRCDVLAMLTAARSDTRWFHQAAAHWRYALLFRGRLAFELGGRPVLAANGKPMTGTFPSLLFICARRSYDNAVRQLAAGYGWLAISA